MCKYKLWFRYALIAAVKYDIHVSHFLLLNGNFFIAFLIAPPKTKVLRSRPRFTKKIEINKLKHNNSQSFTTTRNTRLLIKWLPFANFSIVQHFVCFDKIDNLRERLLLAVSSQFHVSTVLPVIQPGTSVLQWIPIFVNNLFNFDFHPPIPSFLIPLWIF